MISDTIINIRALGLGTVVIFIITCFIYYHFHFRYRTKKKLYTQPFCPATYSLSLSSQQTQEILEHFHYHATDFQVDFDRQISELKQQTKKPWLVIDPHQDYNMILTAYEEETFNLSRNEFQLSFFLKRCIMDPVTYVDQKFPLIDLENIGMEVFPKDIITIINGYSATTQLVKISIRPRDLHVQNECFDRNQRSAVIETTEEIYYLRNYRQRFDSLFHQLHRLRGNLVLGWPFLPKMVSTTREDVLNLDALDQYLQKYIPPHHQCPACSFHRLTHDNKKIDQNLLLGDTRM